MKKKDEYDRQKAEAYAHAWAYGRNPAYYDYEALGGDCTNFASQCLFAGAGVMNDTAVFGWYYRSANDKTPSWTGVNFLYDFLVRRSGGPGPYAAEAALDDVSPGDIIQLSFDGAAFQHSLVVVEAGRKNAGAVLVASHTDDTDNTPLNTYEYKKIRYLHVLGVG